MEVVTLGINRRNSETQGGENLVRINKKSDFPLAVRLLRGGQVVPFPECDFTMEAHIEGSTEIYKAERKGDVCKHCKQDGDRLILFFDNHNFVEGRLLMELTIEYPDPDYSEDGIRQEHFVEIAPIQIVADNGDALDLRLPEPKVVEKVVEKIVEKPVERVVEKVVEKVVDPYTDLQKKAAEWVSKMEDGLDDQEEKEKRRRILGMIFKLVNYDDLGSVHINTELFGGVNNLDEDFSTRLDLAKFLLNGPGKDSSLLFTDLDDSNLNLEISLGVRDNGMAPKYLFNRVRLNTLTIQTGNNYSAFGPNISVELRLEVSRQLEMFSYCTAKKVIVISSPKFGYNYGWYLLPSIGGSAVECFDFSGGGTTSDENFTISNIIEKFLPIVRNDDFQPSIIFRDYTGEATEELKQKVLDKGYTSVEFYMGDTKVL